MLIDDELWKRIIQRCKTDKKKRTETSFRRILRKFARLFNLKIKRKK